MPDFWRCYAAMAAVFPCCWHVLVSAGDFDDYNGWWQIDKGIEMLFDWILPAKWIAQNWWFMSLIHHFPSFSQIRKSTQFTEGWMSFIDPVTAARCHGQAGMTDWGKPQTSQHDPVMMWCFCWPYFVIVVFFTVYNYILYTNIMIVVCFNNIVAVYNPL